MDIPSAEIPTPVARPERTYPKDPDAFARALAKALVAEGFPKPSPAVLNRVVRRGRLIRHRAQTLALRLAHTAMVTDIPKSALLAAALQEDFLFTLDPATIDAHAVENATCLAMDRAGFLRVALRCPKLFGFGAGALQERVARTRTAFALSPDDTMRLIQGYPGVLFRDPATLAARVAELAGIFAITPERVLRKLIVSAEFLNHSPDTLRAKLAAGAEAFGVSIEHFRLACAKNFALVSRRTDTLVAAARRTAKALDLAFGDYVALALRQPTILTLKPATVGQKFKIIRTLARLNGGEPSAHAIIRQLPAALCYSAQHLTRCGELLRLSPGRSSVACIITYPKARIERLIADLRGESHDRAAHVDP